MQQKCTGIYVEMKDSDPPAVQSNPEELESLVLRLARIEDITQRAYAVATRLQPLEDQVLLDLLIIIRDKAVHGQGDFLRIYNGLLFLSPLPEILGEARVLQLMEAAFSRGVHHKVTVLLQSPGNEPPSSRVRPLPAPDLRDIPLGTRKWLARKPDFKMIQKIARDQDHRVIRNLLNNSRLTERDVLKIGSTRPTSPRVLEEIYNNRKWIARYSVKKAIVLNPCSPLLLALSLLTYLKPTDLEEVLHIGELDPFLIEQAASMIEEKTDLHFAARECGE
jgi:hypothetical protein